MPFGSFLKLYREEPRGISENTEKGLQAIPADSWTLHGVRELQLSQIVPVVVAKDAYLFVSDRQMSSGANDQANVLKFAAFRDHIWGHDALYPR